MTLRDPAHLSWLAAADRSSPWPQAHVVVAGLGRSGFAAADALLELGARVSVHDEDGDSDAVAERAAILEVLDGRVRLGADAGESLPADADLVIASPGWAPSAPLLAQAVARGVPVWGDVELAWRLALPDRQTPWLIVAGTDQTATATRMLESILRAEGLVASGVGATGRPVVEALLDGVGYDALAVGLSGAQARWLRTVSAHSSAVLCASPGGADLARVYHDVRFAAVYNEEDPATRRMVEDAEVVEGARAIGFTTGVPGLSMVGVVDGLIVDRAFIPQRRDSAAEIAKVEDVAPGDVGAALAAAALARSFGVSSRAVGDGLRGMTVAL